MRPDLPIAIGAGLISATVFASATTGPALARILLLSIVTLPLALAGYAYGARAAAIAAAVGAITLAVFGSLAAGLSFALALAVPAVVLVYLAMLHRDAAGGIEWYPVGRIVVAAALMAGAVVGLGFILAGDIDKIRAAIRSAADAMVKQGFGPTSSGAGPSEADLALFAKIMLELLPGVSAAFWLSAMLFCQWLAAHVALLSGRLDRPWPDLPAMTYPSGTPLALAAALGAGVMLDGLPRLVVLGFAGAFYTIYVMLGLAIIHFMTRGYSWRPAALTALYVVLLVLNSGASLFLAVLGLADSVRPMRRLPSPPIS